MSTATLVNTVTEIASGDSYDEFVNNGIVCIDFGATWCGPCKAIAPKFTELSGKYPNVKFGKVDVDTQDGIEDVLVKYSVAAVPVFLFFKNGKVVDRTVGADIIKVENTLKKYIQIDNVDDF